MYFIWSPGMTTKHQASRSEIYVAWKQQQQTCLKKFFSCSWSFLQGKSILQVPDTSTRVLDNTRPFLHSSIESFWITPACSKECKYHIFRQYWYTRNVPVFINTGTFQYLGPQVYFFRLAKLVLKSLQALVHVYTMYHTDPCVKC